MIKRWCDWRLVDKVQEGTPEEVKDTLKEANDPSYVSDYDAWTIERRRWAEGLFKSGELKCGETEVKTFRGYRYQIKVGKRGGMVFKSLGKEVKNKIWV
ncbi:MAG: hypothetical protein WCW14_03160 [Candidatus Paceibacterota bacterium]|jgi:hypothetical protein